MLQSLLISNYALIDRIEIEFGEGLNIITGETGAGKSIVLGALSLIMGERADTKTVSDPERKTIVEARFKVDKYPEINRYLEVADIDVDADFCIMRRELTVKGSSRAFINDTPVNLTTMRAISQMLLDIHTQHENLLLTDEGFQLSVLDALADNRTLLEDYAREFSAYKKAVKKFVQFRDNLKRGRSENEYNSYLLEQLDELNLQPGEQEALEQERDIMANAAEIKQHLTDALNVLVNDDRNALQQLDSALADLQRLTEYVADTTSLAERLTSARIEVADIVDTLREYDANVMASDTDLDEIERRLGKIYSLQARHNVTTDKELIEIRNNLRKNIGDVENGDVVLGELEDEAKSAKKKCVLLARKLNSNRTKAAEEFATLLKERALPMGMSNLRCEIRLTPEKLGDKGMDKVEFLFAFNKNQSLMPVGRTASGGEIARVILAIKSILVDKMNLPTIIFDEVDTGVSGDVANKMAELMLRISSHTQVITITHIATVAAHGARHFKVYKEDGEISTNTMIRLLNNAERQSELAAMISGDANDPVAVRTAKSLLDKQKK